MTFLFRLLLGYVRFNFTGGFAEDFLNFCFKEGIQLSDVRRTEDGLSALCSAVTYKRLHPIVQKSGGVTRIYKKAGLPFLVPSIKNRLGFFVGLFSFVMIITLLNTVVWSVEVVGNEKVTTASILYYLEDNGVRTGCQWSSFDRSRLAWQMLSDFDDLAWVHINKDGANAVVEVEEVTPPDMDYDRNRLEGIEAFRVELTADAVREQSEMTLRSARNYYNLGFFGLDIPLYFKQEAGDVTTVLITPLEVKGVKLPISLKTTTQSSYSAIKYSLDDDALEELALKKLEKEKEGELSSYEIVNERVSVDVDDEKAVATGDYVVRLKKE